MKDVSAVSSISVQVPEPVTEGSLDELRDTLVPAEEEDLPQGVVELMAVLILRQRPTRTVGQGSIEVEREGARPTAQEARFYPQAGRLFSKPIPPSSPQPMAFAVPTLDRVTEQTTHMPIDSNPRTSNTVEPLPVDRTVHANAATAPRVDGPLPESLPNLHTARQATSGAQPSVPAPATPRPLPALNVMLETQPGSNRNLLQVPFNNGVASGQVTISRVPDDPARHLQLSPSNALVLEQLKVPFEQVREPAWRLTDSGGEQHHQGSHQAPDDEQAEPSDLPA